MFIQTRSPKHRHGFHALGILILGWCCLSACGDASEEPTPNPSVVQPDTEPACVPQEGINIAIDNSAWVFVENPEDDPFPDRLEEDMIECPEWSRVIEGDPAIFEVDTGACNYLSVQQPLLRDIQPCDTVQAVVAHFPLFAVERAEAHVALALDDEIIWEDIVPIPSQDGLLIPKWEAGRVWPKGTKVTFHLHNHGVNEWRFIDMSVGEGLK